MSQLQKLNENIESLKIAIEWDGTIPLTNSQIEALKKYNGFGAVKAILYGDGTYQSWIDQGASKSDLALHEPMQRLFNLLAENYNTKEYKQILDSLKNSVLTQYFTPAVIPATFYQVLKENMEVKTIYEPSAGSGVFITEALKVFPDIELVEVCEKDILTNKILSKMLPPNIGKTRFYIQEGFEDTDNQMDGKFDVLATNPPYGEFAVYDAEYFKDKTKREFCKKIHNYFVAKSIDKVRDGGVLCWLITNAFLDTVSNSSIRRYLFSKCNFISLTVMPDNLMWDTGGTMAPSHFLVVQKNNSKIELSPEEELLVESSFINAPEGKYAVNKYLREYILTCLFRESKTKIGKNQYGKPAIEVHWSAPISEISKPFSEILRRDFAQRFTKQSVPADPGFPIDYVFDEDDEYDNLGENHENITNDQEEEVYTESYAPGDGNDIVWDNKPVQELKDLLPEYIPFKEGIIVEYEK